MLRVVNRFQSRFPLSVPAARCPRSPAASRPPPQDGSAGPPPGDPAAPWRVEVDAQGRPGSRPPSPPLHPVWLCSIVFGRQPSSTLFTTRSEKPQKPITCFSLIQKTERVRSSICSPPQYLNFFIQWVFSRQGIPRHLTLAGELVFGIFLKGGCVLRNVFKIWNWLAKDCSRGASGCIFLCKPSVVLSDQPIYSLKLRICSLLYHMIFIIILLYNHYFEWWQIVNKILY